MSRVRSSAVRKRLHVLFALIATLGVFTVSACSSDSDSSGGDAETVEVSGQTDDGDTSDDGGSSSAAGQVPDAFPDVPLPEYSDVKIINKGEPDGSFMQLMFIVDPSMETDGDEIMDAYSAQLEADGFEVDDSGPSTSATKGDLELDYHSAGDGTISIAVIGV